MANPYIGEIRMFAGNFAPNGWGFCDGSLVPISEYETLFNLIGTTYGGDGQETFALPDLRGRIPIHQGVQGPNNYVLGESAGVEQVTLNTNQMPTHNHPFVCANVTSNSPNPSNNLIGLSSKIQTFYADNPNMTMNTNALTQAGGSQPHDNFMPYLCLNFIISFFGIFPTSN